MPRPGGSSASLCEPQSPAAQQQQQQSPLRKCSTVVALPQAALRPVNRLRQQQSLCSRCSSLLSLASSSRYSLNAATASFVPARTLCKLCLQDVPHAAVFRLSACGCRFCKECMRQYVEFEIGEGAYDISCPDAQCSRQGVLTTQELEALASPELLDKHRRFRLNTEVGLDASRAWCPRAGCDTVCRVSGGRRATCPTCARDFCSGCGGSWHPGRSCEPPAALPFDSDLIKCCPMCSVPIEKDEGCAQMMCKRCKHVFCWYCLASLDDDFLLRHYDKGPCKNKLGHSRASVIWHRTQVIGIFAGFGILLLVASPLLLLAAPCIVCCKCRICSGAGAKLDADDDLPDESDR